MTLAFSNGLTIRHTKGKADGQFIIYKFPGDNDNDDDGGGHDDDSDDSDDDDDDGT